MRTISIVFRPFVTVCVIAVISVGSTLAQSNPRNDVAPTTRHIVSRYALILFNFDSPALNPLNRRILDEFVYEDIVPGSAIEVTGLTDFIGLEDRNLKLTRDRAEAVANVIRNDIPRDRYASLTERGLGESAPIYDNGLPEGRFYNRTVLVMIDSPE